MAKTDDYCRKFQIMQEAVMKKGHPQSGFFWGNRKSLWEDPKKISKTAYDMLHDWYPRNYSSNLMKLVIQSPHSLDEQQKWVEEIFSLVPSRNLKKALDEPDWSVGSAYKGQNVSKLIKYHPVSDFHTVDIMWSLPPQKEFYRIYPEKGSILSYLKQKDWAHEIYAGNSGQACEENKYHSELSIQFRLTEAGLENWEKVVAAVFSYLKMLEALSEDERLRIFNEIKKIEAINWATKEDKKAQQNCIDAAESMISFEDSARWLDGDDLIFDYDSAMLKSIVDHMKATNCTVILSSKNFENTVDTVEEWMGGKYCLEDLSEDTIDSWKNAPVMNEVFFVPSSNKYLAEDIKVKEDEPSIEWEHVRKIEEAENAELWFKGDGQFKLPRAFISFIIRSHLPYENAKNKAMYEFFPFILIRTMAEVAYDAETALLHYSIDPDTSGLNVKVNGLSDKLSLLLEECLNQIINFAPSQSEFDSLKAQYIQNFKSVIQKPDELTKDLRLSLMQSTKFPLIERRKAFETVTREEMIQFIKDLRKECFLTMHVQGNYYESDVRKLFKEAINQFTESKPLARRFTTTVRLPEKATVLRVRNCNPIDVNTNYIIYWQIGPMAIKDYARNDLLVTIMEEPCFDILRTKKCLGYSVYPTLRDTFGIGGISISISSQQNKFSVKEIHEHCLDFLKQFEEIIGGMTDEKFEEHRAGLIEAKRSDDTKLKQLFNRWNSEIASSEARFDRLETEIGFLEKFSKNEIIGAFKKNILENKRILLVVTQGNEVDEKTETKKANIESLEHVAAEDLFEEYEQVENIDEARKRFGFFPVSHINKNEL
ncbi:Oidioi.mRNA.OKI2018_I69.XSR.g16523.t1.cds [Oikopleura dioica]|uniref:Oidioi.mRNA.OKI2018_I69.XSR.g16523.t1.cds n=1 Tax=Oikopleura dioica TaxID=34765 RepID=A0ABN7SGD5_OIKDI|nr:Oidioi.mRNA.OKI2018_I69.XSR.g16523.t1.cds [Oikopleura dioica]